MSAVLVGYARCSTEEQDLTAQRDALTSTWCRCSAPASTRPQISLIASETVTDLRYYLIILLVCASRKKDEEGTWTAYEDGVPQGASASPLLANDYLHYVFDLWAHQWRTRHAHGDVVIVRFDDFVVVSSIGRTRSGSGVICANDSRSSLWS